MNFLYKEKVGEGKLIDFSEEKSIYCPHKPGNISTHLQDIFKPANRPKGVGKIFLLLMLLCSVSIISIAQTTVSGSVFFDYTNDGFDTPSSAYTFTYGSYFVGDKPIEGIVINAYDQNNILFASVPTDINGDYSIANPGSIPLRLEIANLPEGYVSTAVASTGTTHPLYMNIDGVTDQTVNFGLHDGRGAHVQNVDLMTSCFVFGDYDNSLAAIIQFTYDASGFSGSTPPPPVYAVRATYDEVGSVNGLAYSSSTNNIFAGAFMKRHADVTNVGMGAIFRVDANDNVTVFQRLPNGPNPHPTSVPGDPNYTQDWDNDDASFPLVGKLGIGDIDISQDETILYAVNLFNKRLYSIGIGSGSTPEDPTTHLSTDTISYNIIGNILASDPSALGPNPATNAVPFGIAIRGGYVYYGIVNTAESTGDIDDLYTYVYRFDPDAPTTTPLLVLSFPLDYERGNGLTYNGLSSSANWQPWVSGYPDPAPVVIAGSEVGYPQPWLTDLEFDNNGNMVLGFRDRWGDQMGYNVNIPNGSTSVPLKAYATGDILSATLDGNEITWTIEPMNYSGTGPVQEFFDNDFYAENGVSFHDETSQGGMAIVPGFNEVATTALDPRNPFSGGLEWFHIETANDGHISTGGESNSGLELFSQGNSSDAFAKANGLGDVEWTGGFLPIEIGNLVWEDSDLDGINDAGESGIQGISVELWADTNNDGSADTQIGTATSGPNGYYLFGGTGNVNLLPNFVVEPLTYHELRLDFNSPLTTVTNVTVQNAISGIGDGNDDYRDSDGDDGTANPGYSTIALTTSTTGGNDHSYDFGIEPLSGICYGKIGTGVVIAQSVDDTEDEGEGAPDNVGVQIHTNGDIWQIQMEGTIQAGSQYTIRVRERPGESGTPVVDLYESTDGINFFLHPQSATFSVTNGTNWMDITITADIDVNFLQFGKGLSSTTDYQVDAILSTACDDLNGLYPFGWSFDCEDDVSVELIGVGIEDDLPVTISLANSTALFAAVAEIVYKGNNPGPTITLTDQSGNSYTANRVTPPGTSSDVWYYRAEFPSGTSQINYANLTAEGDAQSMVIYAFYQGLGANTSTNGTFISQSLFQDTYDFTLDIPASTDPRDVSINVPLSEITNDGRVATVVATAGALTISQTINGSDLSLGNCCLNIVSLTLPDVPGNITNIDVSVQSLPVNGVNPQSLVLSGLVEATTNCGCINVTDPGVIGDDEDGCTAFDPNLIVSIQDAVGGSGGIIEYGWQFSIDFGATWIDIANATGATYDPGTVTQTTWFRRVAGRSTCPDSLVSNIVVKAVVTNVLTGGDIADNETNCGPFDPPLIYNVLNPSGGSGGTIVFQWQSRSLAGVWTDIPGATSQNYDPAFITETTQYRRLARRTPCSDWVSSNIVNKTIIEIPQDVSASVSNDLTCTLLFATLSGNSSTPGVSYSWTGPGGFTSNQQNAFVLVPGDYTLVVENNGCESASVTVTVVEDIVTPGATATGGTVTCLEPEIMLQGSSPTPGVNYNWTGPGGFTSSVQNTLVSIGGTYNLTVSNPVNGCVSSVPVIVVVDAGTPVISIDEVISETCFGNDGSIAISVSGGSAPYSITWSAIPPDAWWNFEGNTNDVSGNDHNAVAEAGIISFSNDAIGGGQSIDFDGATSIRYSEDSGFMESTYSAIAISMWIKPASFSGIQNLYEEGGTVNGMALRLNGTNLEGTVRAGSVQIDANTISFPNDNEWHHVALVFDNGALIMFLDGISSGTISTGYTTIPAHSSDGGLGAVFNGDSFTNNGPSYYNGLMDEVRYYLQPLSASEINNLANNDLEYENLTAGTYTVVVTGTNGCSSSTEIIVGSNTLEPGATATGGQLDCNTSSVTLNGNSPTGSVNFSWNGPGGFTSSQQNPAVTFPGIYTLTIEDPANGCTSSASAIVTQDLTEPGASAIGGQLDCNASTVILGGNSPTGGVTYSWTGPGGFNSILQNPVVALPGTYTLTVEDPVNGCTTMVSTSVTQDINSPGAIATGGQLDCNASTVTLGGNSPTGGVNYSWTGPGGFTSSQQNPLVSLPGTYTLTVEDPTNGCTSIATSFVIEDVSEPGALATGGHLDCNTSMVMLGGNSPTGGVNYSWTGPGGFTSSQQNPAVSLPGTYNLTVENPLNGCTTSASTTVTQDINQPGAIAIGGNLDCNTTSIAISGNSPTIGVNYSWTGPGGYSSTSQNPVVALPGTYTLTVENPINGCTTTATTTVIQDINEPGAIASGGHLNCNITSIALSGNSPTVGVIYSWTGPDGYSSTMQNPVVSLPGTYTLTVENPNNGCTTTANTTVTQDIDEPGATAVGGALDCNVDSIVLTGGSPTAGVNFLWTGPGGFTSSSQNPIVAFPGNYTLVVENPDNGCTSTITAIVSQDINEPGAMATGGHLDCNNTTVTLGGNSPIPGVSFIWFGPGGFSASVQNPVVSVPGTYFLTVEDLSNGCMSSTSALVTQNIDQPGALATGGTLTCSTPVIQLTGASPTIGVAYFWTGPSGFTSNQQNPTVAEIGLYSVLITNPVNGCTSTASATVDFVDDLNANIISSPNQLCTGDIGSFEAEDEGVGTTYTWDFDAGAVPPLANGPGPHDISYATPGTKVITLTTERNDCIETMQVSLEVIETPEISNIFSIDPTCSEGGSIFISSIQDPSGYAFNIGDGTGWYVGQNVFVDLSAGIYSISVRTIEGLCEVFGGQVELVDPPIPIIGSVAGIDESTCDAEDGTITISLGNNGTPPYTLSYDYEGNTIIAAIFSGSSFTLTNLAPGVYSNITITDSNDCSASAGPITISEAICCPEALIVNNNPDPVCVGDNPVFEAVDQGPGTIYVWDFGVGSFPQNAIGIGPHFVSYSLAGTQTISLEVTRGGCTISTSTDINVSEPLAAIEPLPQTCVGESVLIEALPAGPNAIYSWEFGPNATPQTSSNINQTVVFSSEGNYTVTLVVTDVNGCTASTSSIIMVDPELFSDAGEDRLICEGESTQLGVDPTTFPPGATFQWIPSDYLDNPTVAQPLASPPDTINYTLVVTFGNCVASADVAVNVNVAAVPYAFAGLDQAICSGEPVTLGGSGINPTGPPDATYLWTANPADPSLTETTVANPVVAPTESTTYTVFVTRDGCTKTDDIFVLVLDVTPADAGPDDYYCLNGTGITIGTSNDPFIQYEWAPLTGLAISPGAGGTAVATPSETTTYTLTTTDSNGCVTTDDVNITVINVQATASGGILNCNVSEIQLSGSSNLGNVTYLWNGPGGFVSSDPNPVVSSIGLYTLVVTEPVNNCTAIAFAVVIEDVEEPGASATGGSITCNNPSVTLFGFSPTFGVNFSWNGPDGFLSVNQNPVVSEVGTYTLTVTNPENGCISTATALVDTPPLLNASVTGDELLCNGNSEGTISLIVSGGTSPFTFDWDNDGIGDNDDSQNLNNLGAGLYSVTVTDANNCMVTASAEINEPTLLTASASSDELSCFGDNDGEIELVVQGGTPPYNYDWDNDGAGDNDDSQDLENLVAGIYTVTVTDGNGCSVITSAAVIQPGLLTASATGETLLCHGDANGNISLTVNGGTAPYTFDWDNDGTGDTDDAQNLSGLSVGIYSVTIFDANGCLSFASAEIIEPTQLSISATGDALLCFNDSDGEATVSAAGGTPPYTYDWSLDGLGDNDDNSDINNLGAGTYTIFVYDANGCAVSTTVEVTEPAQLTANIIQDIPVVCFGEDTGTATASGLGGTPPYSYAWDNGETTPTATMLTAGVHFVSITDDNGCSFSQGISITQPDPLVAIIDPIPQTCVGEGVLIQAAPTGPDLNYFWDFGADADPPTSNLITQTVVFSTVGDKLVTLVITDSNGCTNSTTAIANVDSPVFADPGSDRTICEGESTQIGSFDTNYPPGTVFQWAPAVGLDDPFTQNPVASPQSSTSYSLFVTFGNCVSTAEIQVAVDVNSVPSAYAGPDQFICGANAITLGGDDTVPTGIDGSTFFWSADPPDPSLVDVFAENPVVYPTQSTTYTVTVSRNGCTKTDEAFVLVIPGTSADAGEDQVKCASDGPVTIGSPSNFFFSYSWSPMDGLTFPPGPAGEVLANPDQTTVYTVVQTDANGCVSTDEVVVVVVDCNDPPVAIHDINNTLMDIEVTGNVLTNDYDLNDDNLSVSDANGLPVVSSGTLLNLPNGQVTILPDGSYLYVPNPGFTGTEHFSYTVCDNGMPGPKCDSANVTLEVRENTIDNNPPIANDDVTIIPQNFLGTSNLLDNDADPDGDVLILTPIPVDNVDHGNLSLNPEGFYTYIPGFGFQGEDTFVYEICDEGGLCDTATVTIIVFRVPPANNPATAIDDSNATLAGESVSGNVLTNDYDPDNDLLEANPVPTDLPDNGSVALLPNGSYIYTPNPGFTGNDAFSYQMCDPSGLCDQATVVITVYNQVNFPPVAGADFASTEPGLAVDFDLKPNDYDPDGDPVTYTLIPVTVPSNGTVFINPDGTVRYTPDVTFTGTDLFEYEICDNISGCDVATVLIEVYGTTFSNDLPIATNDVNATPITTPISGNVSANDNEPDGDVLTVSTTLISTPGNGSVQILANGDYTYTPNAGYIGIDAFTYETCDGVSGCDQATVFIVVYNIPVSNDPPVANDDFNSAQVAHPSMGNVLNNDYDVNGDPIIINPVPVDAPDNGSLTFNADGSYIYIPDQEFFGVDTFVYEICDSHGLCSEADVFIEVYPFPYEAINSNLRPFAGDDAVATFVDQPIVGGIMHTNDIDPDISAMTYNLTPVVNVSNGSVTINANGTFDYTPDQGYIGPDQFVYEVCDGPGWCVYATVYITVYPNNSPPIAIDDFNNTLGEIPVSGNVLTNDYDPDQDNLIVTTVNGQPIFPSGSTILTGNGGVTIFPDGSYTFMPLPGFLGDEIFSYEICDDGVPGPLCTEATVTITVFSPFDGNNNPPVANVDATETTVNTPVNIAVLANDFDPDGDPLSTPLVTSSPSNGTVAAVGDDFEYTPDFGFMGKDTFYYQTCDPFGLCDEAMVTIVITREDESGNSPPVAVDDAFYTQVDQSVSGDVSGNDSDPDGDNPLTFNTTSDPANGFVVFDPDGVFTYFPDPGFTGPDQFTYEVCDGVSGCDDATVYIVVGPRNNPPIAIDDINNTLIDIPVNGNVLPNDYDPDGDSIELTSVNGNPIQPGGTTINTPSGTVTIFADGSYVYTPNAGFTGEDQFEYTICDNGIPGPLCDNATVTIEVLSVGDPDNNPPIANNDATETFVDTPVSINVIANDYDPDGDPLSMPNLDSGPSNGTVSQNPDGSYIYTPATGFEGQDEFSYSICDPAGLCNSAVVTIVVIPGTGQPNNPPVAIDDAIFTPFETAVSGNSSLNDYDPDGDTPLTFTALTSPMNGTVTFNVDGTFDYNPNSGFTGTDNFVYQVCDGVSGCDQASVIIVVGPRNNPPIAVNDDNNTFVDLPVVGALLVNDYDPDGHDLSFEGIEIPALPGVFVQNAVLVPGVNESGFFVANAGSITPNTDGTYSFQPSPGFTGVVNITYMICDNGIPGPMCDEGVLTITVSPIDSPGNLPPIANNDEQITEQDTPVNGTVISNDSDPDGDPLTISGFEDGGSYSGTVILPEGTFEFTNIGSPGNGDYTFTPASGFTGEVVIGYEVCDLSGSGVCVNAELTVIVLPDNGIQNDPPFAGDDFATTTEDQPVTGNWFGNDGDPDGNGLIINGFGLPINPAGSPFSIGVWPTQMGGSIEVFNNGSYIYTPPVGYLGPDQYVYEICELGTAESYCANATIYLLIFAGNNPPVAIEDFNNTLEGVSVGGSVMTNDYDPEGDVLNVSGFGLVGGGTFNTSVILPGEGTLTLDNASTGAYTFDPEQEFVGSTTPVEYELCDANACVTAILVIEVIDGFSPVNRLPIANNDHSETIAGNSVSGNILENDFDPDSDPITITGGGNTGLSENNGTWSLTFDGAFIYLPPPGFVGLDTLFTYEICDGISGCDQAVVTVMVTEGSGNMNNPPVAVDDGYVVGYNEFLAGNNFTDNDPVDPDGDNITVQSVNGTFVNMVGTSITTANGGIVQVFQDGSFTYDPATNFSGPDQFVYEVCDGISGCDQATVYITVLPEVCYELNISVYLQGAYVPAANAMRTDLNTLRGLLPGQIPANGLVSPTPPGNPYRGIPWNYDGSVAEENYTGPYVNNDGLAVVDWVLVSLRSTPSKVDEFSIANGLLYEDGTIEFIKPCVLTSSDPSDVWIVVEHRNHMGVMSDSAVAVIDGMVEYDFRQTDSYKLPTSFGQSQLVPGVFAMYVGDGDQTADFPSYDINGLDNIIWTLQNGFFDQYLAGDYDMNGDVNGADIIIWSLNNGLSSAVPKD